MIIWYQVIFTHNIEFNKQPKKNYTAFLLSKLKELPKRTTFIRVTQQINEIYGSINEEKTDVSLPVPPGVTVVNAKRARED